MAGLNPPSASGRPRKVILDRSNARMNFSNNYETRSKSRSAQTGKGREKDGSNSTPSSRDTSSSTSRPSSKFLGVLIPRLSKSELTRHSSKSSSNPPQDSSNEIFQSDPTRVSNDKCSDGCPSDSSVKSSSNPLQNTPSQISQSDPREVSNEKRSGSEPSDVSRIESSIQSTSQDPSSPTSESDCTRVSNEKCLDSGPSVNITASQESISPCDIKPHPASNHLSTNSSAIIQALPTIFEASPSENSNSNDQDHHPPLSSHLPENFLVTRNLDVVLSPQLESSGSTEIIATDPDTSNSSDHLILSLLTSSIRNPLSPHQSLPVPTTSEASDLCPGDQKRHLPAQTPENALVAINLDTVTSPQLKPFESTEAIATDPYPSSLDAHLGLSSSTSSIRNPSSPRQSLPVPTTSEASDLCPGDQKRHSPAQTLENSLVDINLDTVTSPQLKPFDSTEATTTDPDPSCLDARLILSPSSSSIRNSPLPLQFPKINAAASTPPLKADLYDSDEELREFIVIDSDEEGVFADSDDERQEFFWNKTQSSLKQESPEQIKREDSQSFESRDEPSKTQSATGFQTVPQALSGQEARRSYSEHADVSDEVDPHILDDEIQTKPRLPHPDPFTASRQIAVPENGIQTPDLADGIEPTRHPEFDHDGSEASRLDTHESPLRTQDLSDGIEETRNLELDRDDFEGSEANSHDSPERMLSGGLTASPTSSTRSRALYGTGEEGIALDTIISSQNEKITQAKLIIDLDGESEEEPLQIYRRPKRSKFTVKSPVHMRHEPCESSESSASPIAGPSKSLYQIPSNMPPGQLGHLDEYDNFTCHQCLVNTTRPKMICDQSKDPNCTVRVCITCLMKIAVYDDCPELRPPIFNFVPGGTMLCVKCRNLCPCASCTIRRGERVDHGEDLGSPSGFYALTSKERLKALSKKRRRQPDDSDGSDFDPGISNDQIQPRSPRPKRSAALRRNLGTGTGYEVRTHEDVEAPQLETNQDDVAVSKSDRQDSIRDLHFAEPTTASDRLTRTGRLTGTIDAEVSSSNSHPRHNEKSASHEPSEDQEPQITLSPKQANLEVRNPVTFGCQTRETFGPNPSRTFGSEDSDEYNEADTLMSDDNSEDGTHEEESRPRQPIPRNPSNTGRVTFNPINSYHFPDDGLGDSESDEIDELDPFIYDDKWEDELCNMQPSATRLGHKTRDPSKPFPSPIAGPSKTVYRVPHIIPAREPDRFGAYEYSTCHQCRVKTGRPKMICDQSKDPNCLVRLCIACLKRDVYDGHPELRPPIFKFEPGGKMLCVKCRNLCPCASCRRRRGEKEECRRGLRTYYGIAPEDQEKALLKKKEKEELLRTKKEARAKTEKTVSQDDFTKWRNNFEKDDKAQLASTLLSQQHIPSALLNRKAISVDKRVFSHTLTEKPTAFTNQKSPGRCWLFAISHMVCKGIVKKFNLGDFELSRSYILFVMLLEKSNLFHEQMIELVEEPIDSRIISHLSISPLGDGGQWDMVVGLIEKYGLVPKSIYDESYNSANSGEIKNFLTSRLRSQAVELRQIYNNAKAQAINNLGRDPKSATISAVRASRKAKKSMMAQVYRCLAIALGSPPSPSENFRWDFLDNSGKAHSLVTTPFDFYHKHCAEFQPSEYISLINDPRNPFNKSYTIDMIGNFWGGRPIRYVNTSTDVLKSLVIEMIKADLAVWFGCDLGKMTNPSYGIMDTDLINYEAAFGVMPHLSKSERLQISDSTMTRTMVITAVHLDEQGKPVRYKVENSWSDTTSDCDYFVMTDTWFDEYVSQIVLHKSFVPDSLRKNYDDPDPSVLPPWDPLGSLA